MKDIAEIKKAISEFEGDTGWALLKARWESDWNIWRMSPYDAGSGYLSYTSNMSRTYAAKIISLLTIAKLIIRVPEESLSKDLREIANNAERFWYGCIKINDEANSVIPDSPSNRALKAWYSCIRGGFAVRPYIYVNNEGKTIPENKVWDLYNGRYGVGSNGTLWYANTRQSTREEVEDEYQKKLITQAKTVKVIDFWDKESYGVYVDNEWVKPLTPHGLNHCPVYVFKVGATPLVNQDNMTDSLVYTGESAFAGVRGIIPQINKIASDYLSIVHRGVKGPYTINTVFGESGIEGDIFQVEKAASINMKVGESINPIRLPSMPQDASAILAFALGEFQRATLPFTAYGELGFRLSGYAINQLQGSLETVLQPFVECMTNSYFVECRELLKQYTSMAFPPIAVRGRNSHNQPFGYPTEQFIAPDQIQGDWIPEIELSPMLPKDDAQRLEMARLATQSNLLSMRTARTEYLGVQDADLEDAKVSMEWADNLPLNRLFQAYMQAVEDKDMDRAQNILQALKQMIMAQGGDPNSVGGGGGDLTPTEQTSIENPGSGTPPEPTGMSASTMPPEQMGTTPSGAVQE